ncbi:PatA/PatG family cyanobactin maturation protease [Nonomuraea sp. FMUSA5-5]|uniref:PatA/PatG family cyanobactin maturation protease n=1 Tax=Nonomuraea composti TaxID=2720023 RepID=A0ABX1BAS0_9ACTN|nr:PatA/PatG family cyanobactin maturation protease [Nonomuraea sp. FMUSA5-5]NJP92881.1 PatA/PatG family cyanobactin maturation protease [Nonomuraea sp. FMUSA5-5]
MAELSAIPGLKALWRRTTGDDRITIAIVDGLVDETHPALTGAKLTQIRDLWPGEEAAGRKVAHGTAVAGVLLGRHDGPVPGVAPGCRVVSVPVFAEGRRTSQLDLARAIELAADAGAHVVNISGGQLADAAEAEDVLTRAVRRCRDQGVLIVAAAGNDGCLCDHVPAALDGVLAVGACDFHGRVLPSSNFGPGSRRQGLLAPGHDIPVALPGGGTATMSGTSLAAPVVSGVAALLACLQLRQGGKPDLPAIGELLRATATPCDPATGPDGPHGGAAGTSHAPPGPGRPEAGPEAACARYLNGTLDITKAVTAVTASIETSAETCAATPSTTSSPVTPAGLTDVSAAPPDESAVALSCGASPAAEAGCGCGGAETYAPAPVVAATPLGAGVTPSAEPAAPAARRQVYALGSLGYDFGTEARRDTFKQLMPDVEIDGQGVPANPYDPRQMVAYLRDNPSEARPLIWTLNLDLTPIYAIEPVGGYGPGVYERLTDFLDRQLRAEDDPEFVDRISVPGTLPGRTVRLFNGQHVPVIEVNLTRGLYGWSVTSLAHAVVAECAVPAHNQPGAVPEQDRLAGAVADFLQRIYYDLRNFGATSRDRALNYAATNAVQARQTLAEALGRGMALQNIDVEKSPYGRPDSDCWDVKLRFFDPDNSKRAKRVYRFTIDVKDVLPVTIGQVRSWPEA